MSEELNPTRRPMTDQERRSAIQKFMDSNLISSHKARARVEVAEDEGFVSGVCSCGAMVLACHHLIQCDREYCPMKSGQSFADFLSRADQ